MKRKIQPTPLQDPGLKVREDIERMKQNAREGKWFGEGIDERRYTRALEHEPALAYVEKGEGYDRVRKKCLRRMKKSEKKMRRWLRRVLWWHSLPDAVRKHPVCRFFEGML